MAFPRVVVIGPYYAANTALAGASNIGLLLTNNFFLEGGCALSDQMPFLLTFFWRAFVFAMRDHNSANDNEIAILVFSVSTKDFPHEMLLYG